MIWFWIVKCKMNTKHSKCKRTHIHFRFTVELQLIYSWFTVNLQATCKMFCFITIQNTYRFLKCHLLTHSFLGPTNQIWFQLYIYTNCRATTKDEQSKVFRETTGSSLCLSFYLHYISYCCCVFLKQNNLYKIE